MKVNAKMTLAEVEKYNKQMHELNQIKAEKILNKWSDIILLQAKSGNTFIKINTTEFIMNSEVKKYCIQQLEESGYTVEQNIGYWVIKW